MLPVKADAELACGEITSACELTIIGTDSRPSRDQKMLVDGYFVGTLLKASRLQRAYRTETEEPHP